MGRGGDVQSDGPGNGQDPYQRITQDYGDGNESGLSLPPALSVFRRGQSQAIAKFQTRTPQHICTLVHPRETDDDDDHMIFAGHTASVPPIIAFGFVITATNNRICFYKLRDDQFVEAHTVVRLSAARGSIVALTLSTAAGLKHLTKTEHYKDSDVLGHLVVATSMGTVHVIQVSHDLQVETVSFTTEPSSPVAIAVLKDGIVCIADTSNRVEGWKVEGDVVQFQWRALLADFFLSALMSVGTTNHLALLLSSRKTAPSPIASLYLLNIDDVSNAWHELQLSQTRDCELSLEHFLFWPEAGLEPNPFGGHGAVGHGSDMLAQSDSKDMLIAHSDGTIALSTVSIHDGILSWGSTDQIVLSHRAIGIAEFSCGVEQSIVAACLRGGTTYLWEVGNNEPLTVLQLPAPSGSAGTTFEDEVRYVQGFAAGRIEVNGINEVVLLYAGEGGILEAYRCDLDPQPRQAFLVSDLIANGSVELLIKLLKEGRFTLIDTDERWRIARDEMDRYIQNMRGDDVANLEQALALSNTELEGFKKLLFQLAEQKA